MNTTVRLASCDQSAGERVENLPEVLATIGKCRGFALQAGTLAIIHATAADDAEKARSEEEFLVFRLGYIEAVERTFHLHQYLGKIDKIAEPVARVGDFQAILAALPAEHLRMTRADALELSRRSRQEVLPAIYAIIDHLNEMENLKAQAHLARVAEKTALMDGMLTEMGRIGRMIGLISINASVEAARAGGASGRSFQVIAEEVRSLARQSSDLLERMRSRISDDKRSRGSRQSGL